MINKKKTYMQIPFYNEYDDKVEYFQMLLLPDSNGLFKKAGATCYNRTQSLPVSMQVLPVPGIHQDLHGSPSGKGSALFKGFLSLGRSCVHKVIERKR